MRLCYLHSLAQRPGLVSSAPVQALCKTCRGKEALANQGKKKGSSITVCATPGLGGSTHCWVVI